MFNIFTKGQFPLRGSKDQILAQFWGLKSFKGILSVHIANKSSNLEILCTYTTSNSTPKMSFIASMVIENVLILWGGVALNTPLWLKECCGYDITGRCLLLGKAA